MSARARRETGPHGRRHSKLGICAAVLISAGPSAVSACSSDTVTVFAGATKARFSVAVADTPEERNRGLMFVEEMSPGSGMLFVYESPRFASFWMRNTLIPLDMLFAGPDGTVERIHANAVPLDETPIPGGENIQFVLEINGGLAARLGISEGAVLQHPAIPQESAARPCG
ncbi:MAG: DUF192 domain-containing protein [Pseudomonadota bacterium]